MKISQCILSHLALVLVLLWTVPTTVRAEDDSGDGDDDDGWFNFDDDTLWSDYAIKTQKCINFNNQDVIVFSMFEGGHNSCARSSVGTYYATVSDYVKAYTRQREDDAEYGDDDYEVPDEIDYLQCTAVDQDDDGGGGQAVYIKLGCNDGTGKAIAMKAYSDEDCSQPLSSNYNMNNLGIDISDLKVTFEKCNDCVSWPDQNNDDDAEDGDGADVDDNFWNTHGYESSLCSAMWNYKTKCNRKCQKLARTSSSSEPRQGFSPGGKFFLFVFSVLGVFLLLAVHSQRKRMATEDAVMEESVVKKAGLEMKHVVFGIIGIVLFIVIFMLLHKRFLTWVMLIIVDFLLFAYWAYLRFRKEGKVEVGGFRLFGDGDTTAA